MCLCRYVSVYVGGCACALGCMGALGCVGVCRCVCALEVTEKGVMFRGGPHAADVDSKRSFWLLLLSVYAHWLIGGVLYLPFSPRLSAIPKARRVS